MAYPYTPVEIAAESNEPAATHYYPSVDGISLENFSTWAIGISCQDATVSVEVSLDRINWFDVTAMLESVPDFGWLGGPYTFAAGAIDSKLWQAWMVCGEYLRIAATYPNATNDLTAYLARRTL